MLGIIEILCGLILCLLYYYFTATFNFWKKRNVPGPPPKLFFGTIKDVILGKTTYKKYIKDVYDAYENVPFVGLFDVRDPILMIKDPEFIKNVFIKDAEIFSERGVFSKTMVNTLFFMNGTKASSFRSKISPFFTHKKLKDVYRTMLKCMESLHNYLEESLPMNDHIINCTDMAFKLTIDMSANLLIGIEIPISKGTTEWHSAINIVDLIHNKNIIITIFKAIFPQLYQWIDDQLDYDNKQTQFGVDFILNSMKYREEHAIIKSDFIGFLIEMKKNRKMFAKLFGIDITDKFLATQMLEILYGGYETSGLTICNTLYELAFNQNIQNKLREEIRDTYAKHNGEPQYEHINTMPYLNAVFKETLRKYPVVDTLQRVASSSYTFKNTNITLPKKQKVMIPVYALHQDPKIYPKPEMFDPERFMNTTTQSRNIMCYYPFGDGPRNCIGSAAKSNKLEKRSKKTLRRVAQDDVTVYGLFIKPRTVLRLQSRTLNLFEHRTSVRGHEPLAEPFPTSHRILAKKYFRIKAK